MQRLHLDKFVANALSTSRRKAGDLIRAGKITLNGKVENDPAVMITTKDKVLYQLKPITFNPIKIYYALYKPKGVVSTKSDPKKRPTVMDLVRKKNLNLFPVGRLDFWTEGLILITNDGKFTNKVTHPSYKIPKEYSVKVSGHLSSKVISRLKKGIVIDGRPVYPFIIKKIRRLKSNSRLTVVIYEGRNRIIRRVFDEVYHPVMTLRRDKVGPVNLRGLKPGEYKELTKNEIQFFLEREKHG